MDIEILGHVVSLVDSEAYLGEETCLLVFFKKLHCNFKKTVGPPLVVCTAQGAGGQRSVIGRERPSIKAGSAFHW